MPDDPNYGQIEWRCEIEPDSSQLSGGKFVPDHQNYTMILEGRGGHDGSNTPLKGR